MRSTKLIPIGICALALASAVTLRAAQTNDHTDHSTMDHSSMDHSKMDHSQHDTGRDELGRRMYGMKHQMPPELYKELREKVPLYSGYTDAEIDLSMEMMGHEYSWYISPDQLKGPQGVLILLHGFKERGDKMFREQMQPIANIFPTALGVGMSMMMSDHIQLAINDLEDAGAKKIVIVPVVSSATNEMYRQWLYIFGQQKEPEYATVGRVKANAELRFVPPPGDNPLIAEILLDHAEELSENPKNEVVIIAGHGPSGAEDNEREMKVLAGLAKVVQEEGRFAGVYGQTLQDDAPPEIRAANVQKLRERVEAAIKDGKRVLIVTNLISARSIQAKLRDDLKGLEFSFNPKGISQHENFMKWMMEAVREEFEKRS